MKAEIKPGCGQDRVKLAGVLPLDTPFTLNIVPATICNLKCKYCIHSMPKHEYEERGFYPSLMEWDMFLEIIEQAKAFNDKFKVVNLYGVGEPMCNKLLPKMVKTLKDSKIADRIEFITNAVLLDNKMSIELINAGLDRLRISVQGLSSEKYLHMCGVKLNFESFVENIRFFYNNKKNTDVYIKILDAALEKRDVEKFYEVFGNISDRIFVERVMPVFEGVDYSDLIKGKVVMDRYGNVHEKRMVCPMCFFTLSVQPDGSVWPCDNLSDPAMFGNVKSEKLYDIWHGDKLKQFWKMQLHKKRMESKICKNCCAPDDVSQQEDELDSYSEELLNRIL